MRAFLFIVLACIVFSCKSDKNIDPDFFGRYVRFMPENKEYAVVLLQEIYEKQVRVIKMVAKEPMSATGRDTEHFDPAPIIGGKKFSFHDEKRTDIGTGGYHIYARDISGEVKDKKLYLTIKSTTSGIIWGKTYSSEDGPETWVFEWLDKI